MKRKEVKGDDDVNKHGSADSGDVEDDKPDDGIYYCVVCKKVTKVQKAVECELCQKWCHINCDNMPIQIYNYMRDSSQQVTWYCIYCKREGSRLHTMVMEMEKHNSCLTGRLDWRRSLGTLLTMSVI